jgi:hypothetical protein
MAKKVQTQETETKTKAIKVDITQMVITHAYQRNYKTGSTGFFGQGMDPQTGKKYQILGCVEVKPKA